ncbi:hypothetical protein Q4540_11180 [Pseudoalteromonas carrageenovora]|uniref:hypothetical protein n=1 Tax=Pseudoalteromonas carrageenovora TaxID=227 RepID=UPI0026E3FC0C|nr:hypothetical protein [Pseudoalteromonas carrageenovora]MDO6636840.1 hypothetical protein [Pseudoalteromonas carrageenovora]MDO6649056.1 hypothetical protein [Pseudoalteromonas carrageenovora]
MLPVNKSVACIYAYSFLFMPATGIYNKEFVSEHEEIIKDSHIYFIGYIPFLEFGRINKNGNRYTLDFLCGGKEDTIHLEIPREIQVSQHNGNYFIQKGSKKSNILELLIELCIHEHQTFDVKYIGKSYGSLGSRNAIDRLKKHETLQQLSIENSMSDTHQLAVLLLEVANNMPRFMVCNAHKKESEFKTKLDGVIDIKNASSQESLISLFEAAFIKYFKPEFNKFFKEKFPSKDQELLKALYDNHIDNLIAEINIDGLPYKLKSAVVEPQIKHAAKFRLNLEKENDLIWYML